MATAAQKAHALIDYYESGFVKKYGSKPTINRVKARWDFDSILRSLAPQEVKDLIDYYFTTPPTKRHDLTWFMYNYHDLLVAMRKTHEDAARSRRLMEESKQRAEQWRQSGKQGIAND